MGGRSALGSSATVDGNMLLLICATAVRQRTVLHRCRCLLDPVVHHNRLHSGPSLGCKLERPVHTRWQIGVNCQRKLIGEVLANERVPGCSKRLPTYLSTRGMYGSTLAPSRPHVEVITSLGWLSAILTASSGAAKPPNTTWQGSGGHR